MARLADAQNRGDKNEIRKSMAQQQTDMRDGIKGYLNKYESFGVRMSAAQRKSKAADGGRTESETQQASLFID
jgi:hypothetical protein